MFPAKIHAHGAVAMIIILIIIIPYLSYVVLLGTELFIYLFCFREFGQVPSEDRFFIGFHSQAPQPEGQQQQQQQTIPQNSNNDRSSAQVLMQITTSNGMASVNNSLTAASITTSANTIVELLHQNSMNSRHQNSMNNASSPYRGNFVQIPSPGYSTSTTIS